MAASKSDRPSVINPFTAVSTSDLLALARTLVKFVNTTEWQAFSDVQLGHLSAVMQTANDLVLEICIDSGVKLSDYSLLSDLASDVTDVYHMRSFYEEPCGTCSDLYEHAEFCHDENCYMPTLRCAALDRARVSVSEISTKRYIVSKTMVDEGFRSHLVQCFENEHDAIDFMLGWQGNGDGLTLRYGDETVGTVDLWSHTLSFKRAEHVRMPKHLRYDAYDEDIPF